MFLTLNWTDWRLANITSLNEPIALPDSFIAQLWVPDLYFTKEKQGQIHSITDTSRVLKVNPLTGQLLFSQR